MNPYQSPSFQPEPKPSECINFWKRYLVAFCYLSLPLALWLWLLGETWVDFIGQNCLLSLFFAWITGENNEA